ncbi:putative membrane protein (TIGR02234 family) [Haloactinospora alba]|uniref:Putative membrane protein (TIGR02234 family) n=1 Tax=Haloactinospora alba TaxID=405555 RepID=A0A543NI01_9ACTN|nr:Trp biosynthesis-associated membrane protein [Haloactinospora alba]TQN31451.1 putative membrane protein (TIGR02234 family) [Haloactinospora alba]
MTSARWSRGEYTTVLLAILAGTTALLTASGQTWASGSVVLPDPLAPASVALSGDEVTRTVSALGWAGLAGVAALVASRGKARRVLGVPVAGFGAVAAYDIWHSTRGSELTRLASEQSAVDGPISGPTVHTAWPVLAAAGAVLLVAAGVATVVRGGAWPVMGSRYDRHGSADANRAGEPAELWKTLDSGVDPTLGPVSDDVTAESSSATATSAPATDTNVDSKES